MGHELGNEAQHQSDEASEASPSPDHVRSPVARLKARAREGREWTVERRAHLAIVDVPFRVFERDLQVAGYVLGGGLAVRLFLWLLPVGLLAAAAFGFLDRENSAAPASVAKDMGMSAAATASVVDAAEQAGRAAWYLLLIGLGLLVWASYTGAKTMQILHSVAWGMTPQPLKGSALYRAPAAFCVVFLLFIAAGAGGILRSVSEAAGLVLIATFVALSFALWLWFSLRLPHAQGAGWKDLVPGALLMALCLQVLSLATVFYVAPKLESSSVLYGALGFAATFLFWLGLISRLTVYSAILNYVIWNRRR